jgi:O-succinylbenzoate synthase
MDSVDDLLEAIGRGVEAGFKRTKLKYGPGWDLPVLKEVRRNFPDHTFHIDCNSGYRLSDLEMFREIDQLGLAMIEQPLQYDDLADHARLQKELRTPVCLDESVTSPDKVRKAIEMGSCQIVNIKTCRVGGLTPALEIHDRCRQAGIPCWIGSMLESAVGARVNLALATLENFTYPADLFPTSRFYRKDLARPEVFLDRGPSGEPVMSLSEEPGHGTEPDPGMLEECTVARSRISA